MIDRRELLSGAILLATSAAILRVRAQAPADVMSAATASSASDDLHAEAVAAAAKAGPLPI